MYTTGEWLCTAMSRQSFQVGGLCVTGVGVQRGVSLWVELLWRMVLWVGDTGDASVRVILGGMSAHACLTGESVGIHVYGGQCWLCWTPVTASCPPTGPVPAGDGGRVGRGRPHRQHGARPHRPGGQRHGHHALEPDAGHAEEAHLHVAPAPEKLGGCWGEPAAPPGCGTPAAALPQGQRAEGALPGRWLGREPPPHGAGSRAGAERDCAALGQQSRWRASAGASCCRNTRRPEQLLGCGSPGPAHLRMRWGL